MEATLASLVANYVPPIDSIATVTDTSILLLVGPSGTGKDSVKRKLLGTGRYFSIVSHTTRPPRVNSGVPEMGGVDYHFVSMDEISELVRSRQFVQIKAYGGHYYGTSIHDLQHTAGRGGIAVTDVDIQGAAAFSRLPLTRVSMVFLMPPSLEELLQRLRVRGQTASLGQPVEDEMARRLHITLTELEYVRAQPESFALVVNDELTSTVDRIDALLAGSALDTSHSVSILEQLVSDIRRYIQR